MRADIQRFAVLLLLLTLAACASAGRRSAAPAAAETTVRVQNQNWLDMNIYVVRSGQRIRLGMVPGASTRVLTIPANLVFGSTSLQFLADPVGSRQTPISNEISVHPGDQVTLLIPNY